MVCMNNNRGSMILLTVIAVCTLLVTVVGATFAYFGIALNGAESESTIEVTSGTLSVEYDSNSKLEVGSSIPGSSLTDKAFTITGVVTGSTNLNYEVMLKVSENTYTDGALVYTITSTNTSNNGSTIETTSTPVLIPSGVSNIRIGIGTFAGPIVSGATHSYSINITHAYTDDEALINANQDKSFKANLSVVQTKK